jgi:hypothetical protein
VAGAAEVSDLTPAQWREVEKAAVNVVRYGGSGQYIALGVLRTIIRKSRRSNDQNSLLWALYQDILNRGGNTLGGWTKDDLHEYFLGEWSGWDRHEAFGRVRLKPKRRSSRLTKTEFSDYVEFIVRKVAEHGIVVELPGDAPARDFAGQEMQF